MTRLAQVTDCVRTYSVDFGLDQIAGIAAKHGLKVMQGLWLSSSPIKSQYQIETAVALANKYPGTIRSVVVGNEVLLRGDMTATDLANTIRAVKARVHVPVTYADVWEFWLRNPTWRTPSISSPSISCLIGRISRFPPEMPSLMSRQSAVRSSTRFPARKC